MSILAYHTATATVKGLKDFPKEDRPPVTLTFVAFRLMVGLGFLFVLLTVVGWFKRHKLEASPGYLKIMLYAMPLPYIALQAGWIVTEVGRQPWIVYGMMRTKDAVSPIATSQVAIESGGLSSWSTRPVGSGGVLSHQRNMPGAGRSRRRRQPDRGRGKNMLETIWFILWGVLWSVYFMLDGYDLGLGTLMPFLARNETERRLVYRAMGPFWDGNEVWLITAGGRDVRGIPHHLCHDVQRPLFRPDAHPVRPDHPGRVHCLPG